VKKNIIIILGEPNSISYEIFLKSLNYIKDHKFKFIIIGNYSLLKKQADFLKIKINIDFYFSKVDNLINTSDLFDFRSNAFSWV
jgi:4-hydroxy-L-threonine phosphate dehydrogenase PdxA